MAATDAARLTKPLSSGSVIQDPAGQDVAPSERTSIPTGGKPTHPEAMRLRRHADYQRAYKASRKQFSPSMTYFCAPQPAAASVTGARVGITAGRVLGNAVERNRIKRRMREAIRANQSLLISGIDVILHPRRSVLEMKYAELQLEIGRIFSKIADASTRSSGNKSAANTLSRP